MLGTGWECDKAIDGLLAWIGFKGGYGLTLRSTSNASTVRTVVVFLALPSPLGWKIPNITGRARLVLDADRLLRACLLHTFVDPPRSSKRGPRIFKMRARFFAAGLSPAS